MDICVSLSKDKNVTCQAPLRSMTYYITVDTITDERFSEYNLSDPLRKMEEIQPWYDKRDCYIDLESLVRGIRTKPMW